MAEANRDEVNKCKQIAMSALSEGNTDKAIRFLQKAERMSPGDASIQALLAQATSGGGAAGAGASTGANGDGYQRAAPDAAPGPRHRPAPSASSGPTRTNREGGKYNSEQMQEVQKILRTRDYYEILGLDRNADEKQVKSAYKKLALRLHPDKNKAPGAEEAFKKVSKAVQCLTDESKKQVYDRYGDEEHMPQQHRQAYQQDFMTPEDLFAAFFGGGVAHHHGRRQHADGEGTQGFQPAHMLQILPVILLLFLSLASNFGMRDSASRFSFSPSGHYQNERSTATLHVNYYVANDFDDHYPDGTRSLSEFERQVEIYHVGHLDSECDRQQKLMYRQVIMAKRREASADELEKIKKKPRPACKDLDKIKKRHPNIARSALHMGVF